MVKEAFITKLFYSEDPGPSEKLDLSVLVSPGSFMYAISTNDFKSIIELCHVELKQLGAAGDDLTEKISFLVNNHLLHQKKFDKVYAGFLNPEFTTVPESYAGDEQIKPLLKFSTGVSQVKRSLHHNLKNIQFCFTIEQDLIGYFERTFPNAAIRHSGAVNINLLLSQHSLLNCDLFLNVSEGCIEITAKDKNGLLFYNVFNYESDEDILYYLLFMMEQFGLNPLQVKLGIAAQRQASDDLMRTIKKYIKQVSFCVVDPSVKLAGELSTLPQHYYFTLLNQHLCAL